MKAKTLGEGKTEMRIDKNSDFKHKGGLAKPKGEATDRESCEDTTPWLTKTEFTPQGFVYALRIGGLAACGSAWPGILIDKQDPDGRWSGGVLTKEQAEAIVVVLANQIKYCHTGYDPNWTEKLPLAASTDTQERTEKGFRE